jgi:hypothetical protein
MPHSKIPGAQTSGVLAAHDKMPRILFVRGSLEFALGYGFFDRLAHHPEIPVIAKGLLGPDFGL